MQSKKRQRRTRIHTVRLWKLGSLEHKIIPTARAIKRLAKLLAQINQPGVADIVWGPELSVEIISSEKKEQQ